MLAFGWGIFTNFPALLSLLPIRAHLQRYDGPGLKHELGSVLMSLAD